MGTGWPGKLWNLLSFEILRCSLGTVLSDWLWASLLEQRFGPDDFQREGTSRGPIPQFQ